MNEVLPPILQPYAPLIIGAATALVIFIVGWIVAKWANALVLRATRKRRVDEAVARFVASLAQYFVLAAAVVAALGEVGVETTSIVALIGAAGLAIGLALQGTLGHLASGLMLLIFRPFSIGDVVTTGGHTGTVEEIGLFATTLLTPDNMRITLPNGSVTGGSITNVTIMGTRRAEILVGIAYGEDPNRATEAILAAVAEVEGVLADPAPAVVVAGFGASAIDLKVFVWMKSPDFGKVSHASKLAVYEALNAANVEIPFDQLVVHRVDPPADPARA